MFDVIALDADDTLWHSEPLFAATQAQFRELLASYHGADWIDQRLHETELKNLQHFGYGVKGFVLSMLETAIELTEGRISGGELRRILDWGQEMLAAPVELLEGVRETVQELAAQHFLILVTKGDLFHQESKLARSGLGDYFEAIEIVSEKSPETYSSIMLRHRVVPQRFLMVGNSLRSDVLPVLEAGGVAVHVPYAMTWRLEDVPGEVLAGKRFARLSELRQLPDWIDRARQYGSRREAEADS